MKVFTVLPIAAIAVDYACEYTRNPHLFIQKNPHFFANTRYFIGKVHGGFTIIIKPLNSMLFNQNVMLCLHTNKLLEPLVT